MSLQKARDYGDIIAGIVAKHECDDKEYYIYRNILNAIAEGHNGCISYHMSDSVRNTLEHLDFQIEEEQEEDCAYFMISWQQEVII